MRGKNANFQCYIILRTGNVLTVKRTNIYKSILSTSLSNLTFLYNFLKNVLIKVLRDFKSRFKPVNQIVVESAYVLLSNAAKDRVVRMPFVK